MRQALFFISLCLIIAGSVFAGEIPELTDRDITIWPDNDMPPFAMVMNVEDSSVIRVLNADFDPLTALPELPYKLQFADDHIPAYQLVQFTGPITESHKTALRNTGLEPLVYIANFTFISKTLSPGAAVAAMSLPEIRWVGPFEPAYRIDPMIGQMPLVDPERLNDDHLTLIVTIFEGESLSELKSAVLELGAEVVSIVDTPYRNSLHMRLLPESIPELAHVESIYRIEERAEFFTMNHLIRYVLQAGTESAGTPLWDNGVDGTGEIIGVMDSGVDPHHCFFIDEDEGLPGSTVNHNHRKIVAYRTYGGGNVWDGCSMGHGTHVAGTAAGYPDDGSSNLQYSGIARGAKITVGDIGGDSWWECLLGMISPPDSLTGAFADTMADGGYFHTNSWGSASNSYDSYCVDVDSFMWNNKDFLVLFAAGNSGPGAGTVGFPGTAKNLVCVGGSDNLPNTHNMFSASSRGPVSGSNRMAPTITSPATNTSVSPAGIHSADNTTSPTGRTCGIVYSGWSGTSMACPGAAGAAALVRQYFRDGYYPTGMPNSSNSMTPSAAMMKAVLINSAQNMTGTTARPSNDQGWGRIMLDDTLYFPGDDRKLIVQDEHTGVATGQTHSYDITVTNPDIPLKISLVWTDRSGNNLVNDLDLVVTNGSTTWYGNNFSGGWSNTSATRDRTNPAEGVYLDAADVTAGTYTIHVEGFNVPNGEPGGFQPYALVISGGVQTEVMPTPTPGDDCINHGDVNFDGSITAADAQLAFSIALGVYTPTFEEECAADCNGDGIVTAADAQLIFETAIGQNTCVDPL